MVGSSVILFLSCVIVVVPSGLYLLIDFILSSLVTIGFSLFFPFYHTKKRISFIQHRCTVLPLLCVFIVVTGTSSVELKTWQNKRWEVVWHNQTPFSSDTNFFY